jgi:hypothetical protein
MPTEILRPNAPGDSAALTAVGSSPQWACVDEVSPDDNDYVRIIQSAGTDYYNLGNTSLGAGATITQVDITGRFYTSDTTPDANTTFRLGVRLSGVDSLGPTRDMFSLGAGGTWNNYTELNLARPGGGAWSVSDLNALQSYVRIAESSAGHQVRCSWLYVTITYTDPPGATLKQGATTIATWEIPAVAGKKDLNLTLTNTQINTITFPANDLTLEIYGVTTGFSSIRVSRGRGHIPRRRIVVKPSSVILPKLSASGVAEADFVATGAANLPSLTVAGSAIHEQTAAGAVTLASLTASGVAAADYVATGAVTLPSLVASGSAIHEQTATGVATLPSLIASGSADTTESPSATGVTTLPSLVASASGLIVQLSTGTPTLPALVASGTAVMQPSATGVATLPSLAATGAVIQTYSASAVATLPSLIVSGSVLHIQSAVGAATLPSLVGSAVGEADYVATGAGTIPSLVASGSALHIQTSTGTITLPALIASGVVETDIVGSCVVALPSLIANGTAVHIFTANATPVLPSLVASGVAITDITAAGVTTLPSLVVSGNTVLIQAATGAPSLPSLIAASTIYRGQVARPISTTAAGNWTAVGAGDVDDAMRDIDSATYAELTSGNSPSTMIVGLETLDNPDTGDGVLHIRVEAIT